MKLFMGKRKITVLGSGQSARVVIPHYLVDAASMKSQDPLWIIYDTERQVIELHREEPEEEKN